MTSRCVFACLVLFALLLSGCTAEPVQESLPEPGLSGLPEGKAQAVGVLTYVDLEGGFWRISETDSHAGAEDAPSVVVIANPAQIEDGLDAREGEYVRAVGTLFNGASVRMAGQEMIVETIEVLHGASD